MPSTATAAPGLRRRPGAYQGYFDREHDQWENFYIEQANWALLPAGVAGWDAG